MKGERGLWIGVAIGGPILLLGLRDVVEHATRTHPFELARWVVGAALVLDLVVLPVCLLFGRAISGRPALRWALSASATLVLVGWPSIRGYGRSRGNPSLLPRDYGTGTIAAMAVTVGASLAWWAVSRSSRRSPEVADAGSGSEPR